MLREVLQSTVNHGDKTFLMLRNHGLLTVAETVADAFLYMYILQKACEVQVLAQSTGRPLISVPDDIVRRTAAQSADDHGATTFRPGQCMYHEA